jgi:hypothetical protein
MQQVADYLNAVLNKTLTPDVIVIISTGTSLGGDVSQIAPQLKKLGANTDFDKITDPSFAFSFIGIQGLKAGQAYQVGDGGLEGLLAPDASNNYAFLQLDYTTFALTPSTTNTVNASSIRVGTQPVVYNTAPLNVSYPYNGGFVLAVFATDTLALQFSQTYAINADVLEHTNDQTTELTKQLATYQGNKGLLICLTSFGAPGNADYSASKLPLLQLAKQIGSLGGTYDYVYPLNAGQTYP